VLYEEVAAMANQLGLNWYRALLLIHWADACLARGEPGDLERAQSLYRESQVMFERLEVVPQLNLIRSRLKELRQVAFDQATVQQKVARELAQAGRIQESFLPVNPPQLTAWQIAVTIRPARQTSGDYYDFIPLPDGQLGIVIADVVDKGIAAALYMASSRTLIRAYASEHPNHPELAIEAANRRLLMDTHGGLYVTVFYGVLDPNSGRLTYCNAGHNPPFLLSGTDQGPDQPNRIFQDTILDGNTSRTVQTLDRTGVAVGIFEDARWESRLVQIDPGSMLALYTDGITEAQNALEQSYGVERLVQSMRMHAGMKSKPGSAVKLRDAILMDLSQFCAQSPQMDDITLMILLRETEEEQN
jgi:sigma-B regulation protein RsbU (phosphoserine phosphatase)